MSASRLRVVLSSVWNMSEKRARFVEVKSPNDHLSETQKIWISVLQTAGVEVEVCHVVEAGSSEKGSLKGANKRSIEEDAAGRSTKRRKPTKIYDMEDPDELKSLSAWKVHTLTGDRAGTWSLSVTKNRRLTFRIDTVDSEIYDVNLEDYH